MRWLKEGYAPLTITSQHADEHARSKVVHGEFQRIAVAYDGSEFADKALQIGEMLARQFGAELMIVEVVIDQSYLLAVPSPGLAIPTASLAGVNDGAKARAESQISQLVLRLTRRGVKVRGEVLSGVYTVADELSHYAAREGVDLFIVGTRGMGTLRKLFLGSVSESLTSQAGCAVLVVR